MTITVEQLRKAGYKVRVTHSRTYVTDEFFYQQYCLSKYRLFEKLSSLRPDEYIIGPLEYGGETFVEVTSPDGKINSQGIATCSIKDHFNRRRGLHIALSRALKNFPLEGLRKDPLEMTNKELAA